MGFSLVAQLTSSFGYAGSTQGNLNTTGAKLIVIGVSHVNNNAITLSDNKGNTYTALTRYGANSQVGMQLFYCINPTVGTNHSFTLAGTFNYYAASVTAWSCAVTPVLGNVNGATANPVTSLQTSSVIPNSEVNLLITANANIDADTYSINESFTTIADAQWVNSNNSGITSAYLLNATTAKNPTWSKAGSASRLAAAIACFYEPPPPLSVDFDFVHASVNLGDMLPVQVEITGGIGTKHLVWKIDGFPVTATLVGENYIVDLTGFSAGEHELTLEVTDDSETVPASKNFFIGTITGVNNLQNGASSSFTTNVPNPVFSVISGSGSFSGNTFTASGVGSVTIKATNSLNSTQFSTKVITVYEPAVALFSLPDEIVTGQSFSTDNESEGTIVNYKWELNNVQVGTSENVTLNLGVGEYELKLTITDAFGFDSVHSETFTVLNVTPVITSKSPLPYARIGNPYEFQFQVSGGSGSGVYSLEVEGNLPENSVSFGGLLSIAEVGDEDYSFILKWEDADGRTYTKAFTIPVSELAYISFCHKRPLRKKRLLSQEIFENLDGTEDVAEWREMKWEYFMNSLYIRNVERDELHNFLNEHRNRTPFLWHNPDRDEIKIVKITEFGEDNEMLAYGECSFTLRDV